MHSDERVELKNQFLSHLNEKGWNDYVVKEKRVINYVNRTYKLLYILFVATILSVAFASMRQYIPRIYAWFSLGGAIIWLFIERFNLSKVDGFFLKDKQQKLIKELREDTLFLTQIEQFAHLDMISEQQYIQLKRSLEDKKEVSSRMLIEEMKKTIFTLNTVKTFEEMQKPEIEIKENYREVIDID